MSFMHLHSCSCKQIWYRHQNHFSSREPLWKNRGVYSLLLFFPMSDNSEVKLTMDLDWFPEYWHFIELRYQFMAIRSPGHWQMGFFVAIIKIIKDTKSHRWNPGGQGNILHWCEVIWMWRKFMQFTSYIKVKVRFWLSALLSSSLPSLSRLLQLEGTYDNYLVQLPHQFRADQAKARC